MTRIGKDIRISNLRWWISHRRAVDDDLNVNDDSPGRSSGDELEGKGAFVKLDRRAQQRASLRSGGKHRERDTACWITIQWWTGRLRTENLASGCRSGHEPEQNVTLMVFPCCFSADCTDYSCLGTALGTTR